MENKVEICGGAAVVLIPVAFYSIWMVQSVSQTLRRDTSKGKHKHPAVRAQHPSSSVIVILSFIDRVDEVIPADSEKRQNIL